MNATATNPPLSVSVIIPTFNRARFLPTAIDSCLSQRSARLSVEVVVANDGSTDDTHEVLAGYGKDVTVLDLGHNCGRNRARNLGLARATGEFVKFLDSDDYLEPGVLEPEVSLAVEQQADIV